VMIHIGLVWKAQRELKRLESPSYLILNKNRFESF
jgi:hypothetical protein